MHRFDVPVGWYFSSRLVIKHGQNPIKSQFLHKATKNDLTGCDITHFFVLIGLGVHPSKRIAQKHKCERSYSKRWKAILKNGGFKCLTHAEISNKIGLNRPRITQIVNNFKNEISNNPPIPDSLQP